MKINIIADTHCQHGAITVPECDILIHAGDACAHGNEQELRSFAIWFNNQTQAKTRLYIPGNHDRFVESYPDIAKLMFTDGSKLLLDELVEVDGLRIFGTPWTPELCNWAFQGDDTGGMKRGFRDLERHFGLLPDCDVLVCHGPAFGIQDKTDMGDRVGSVFLLKAIHRIKPKLFACGHVHKQRGVWSDGTTKFVNACICDENYQPTRTPIEVIL